MKLRLCAAVVLSLPLSIALAGALAWVMPGGWHRSAIPAMVLFFPLWIGMLCSAFVLPTTTRVVATLGAGNVAAFALLFAARAMQLA
jgi:hypothetical protein